MSRIPQPFIDDLLARVDIVEIIQECLPLKRAGHEFKACCPFHNEKTPSFYVSPQKQFYHCFGCGAHGTAIGFLIDYEHLDFLETVETLANRIGMEIPHENQSIVDRSESQLSLYPIMEEATQWYTRQLQQTPEAQTYLAQRGLNEEVIHKYRLGYAPATWDTLLKKFSQYYSPAQLEQAGLLSRSDNRLYDRFRKRIMFPIRDARGRPVGFGGRVLDDSTPKYLNSSETPLFHKGRELYGLHEARQAGAAAPTDLVIVEGYLDVISLAQTGISNTVATLGTATTSEHLQHIYRMVDKVYFCFDGDRAGRKAAWRALEQTLPILADGREAYFLFLPEGEDPDSFIRKHGNAKFQQRLATATPLSAFFLNELHHRHPDGNMESRAALLEEAVHLLRLLEAPILRELIIDTLAKETLISPNRIMQKLIPTHPFRKPELSQITPSGFRTIQRTPIRTAIAILLAHPHLARNLSKWITDPDEPIIHGSNILRELLEIIRINPHISTAAILERWRGKPEYRHLSKLLEWVEAEQDEEINIQELQDAFKRIREQQITRRVDGLLAIARNQGLDKQQKAELKSLLSMNSQCRQKDAG